MQQWEYQQVAAPVDKIPVALEHYGREGWELACGIPSDVPSKPVSRVVIENIQVVPGLLMIFKRPLPLVTNGEDTHLRDGLALPG